MHNKKLIFLTAFLLVAMSLVANGAISAESHAPNKSNQPLWQDIAKPSAAVNRIAAQKMPSAYRLVQTNVALLQSQLATAPVAGTDGAASILMLPLPDGEFGRYAVTNSPIMESGLAAKYPEIQTYTVQGIDDPSATGRLDMTPRGFHAYLQTTSGEIYIDPYQNNDLTRYISYHKSAAQSAQARTIETILQQEFGRPTTFGQPTTFGRAASSVPVGNVLRTYQVVMSASGEYADFVCSQGGNCSTTAAKRANAMAAIVTGMNRVTQIYERDLSIRLVLVNNNDTVVFTNKNTDPYLDGTSANDMIDELPDVVDDSPIGINDYDLGHVIGAGGGGGLASPFFCGSNDHYDKSSGATALFSPTGDPFWVDYTAHEIGHQFGALHTFNASTAGGCSGGNRTGSVAYEPGGGTTIMSYAGICGGQDLQNNSDAMFHAGSYDEIIAHVTTGSGASCSTNTNTGNTAPTVSAGANYTIPKDTPFRLTAVRSDTEQPTSALTTSWEQFDKGPAWSWASIMPNTDQQDNQSRPIFRTYLPSQSPTRIFPQLPSILDGTYNNIGEDLPSIDQVMTFRATVRDNAVNGGGVAHDSMTLTVEDNAGPFRVTSHALSPTLTTSDTTTVFWNVADTDQAPINCGAVDILFSADNGATFTTNLATNTPNDGSQQVTIPASLAATTQGRIQVKCSNNIFFDISKSKITIEVGPVIPTISLDTATLNVNEPDGDAAVVVRLSAVATSTVTVDYATAFGSASAGTDFTNISGTVSFPAGSTSQTILVPIIDDSLVESDETLSVTLSNPSGGVMGTPSATIVTIKDDEATNPTIPKLSLGAATYSVAEDDGTVDVEIMLSTAAALTVTVDYETYDGSATEPSDYSATDGTVEFAPGETSKIISVSIIDDGDVESDETIGFEIFNESGAPLIAPSEAVITITDNDDTSSTVYLPVILKE